MCGWLVGCATHRDPTARLLDATVLAASDEGLHVQIMLEVTNHDSESIRLDEIEYRVSVNGAQVHEAVRSAQATLASHDVRTLAIPTVLRYDRTMQDANAQSHIMSLAVQGSISYVAPGELSRMFRDMGFPKPTMSVSGSHELAVHEGVSAAVETPQPE